MQHPLRTMQDEFERMQQKVGHGSSSAISTGSSSNSSNTDSGVATPQLTTAGSNSNASAPLPMALSAGVSASLASQGYLSSSSSRSNTALQLSPGPFNANFSPSAYELGTSFRNDASPGYLTGNDYSEVLGPIGLQSFMSLNAPASPKRLSALELTFPSLEALGYSSDEDDERDPGPYAVSSRGRMYRRGSSTSSKSATSPNGNSRPTSPVRKRSESRPRKRRTSATLPAAKERPARKRLSSFAEYGDRPAPTSLAILAGLISGSARIIDRAYAEQGIPVPDIDDPGLPKSKYAKEQKELKISNEIYKAIEVCIEACHQMVGIVQRPEVTCAEAAYAFELSAAIKVTTEAHVVEVLRDAGHQGMHIIPLAEKVKMNPGYLLRIMRCLAAHNIFLEMGAGTQWFANNRVSLRLDSREPLTKVLGDPPMESPDNARVEIRSLISHATDYTWHTAGQLEDRLKGAQIAQITAADPDEAAALLYRQLNARKCSSYLGDPPNLINVLKSLGNGLVIDLGSGLGRDLLGVAKAYPHLRIELHDKAPTMELARDLWYRLAPRSVMTKAVTFHPHDLLSSQKYPRGSTYLLRNHLAHWGDADALTILKKARASAFNSSRLFVEESTSDDELPSDLSFLHPDMLETLEPVINDTSHNADRIQHLLDVAHLLSGNGRKRTIIELVLLLEKAGWRTEKVDNSSGGRCKIFFCRPIVEPVPADD